MRLTAEVTIDLDEKRRVWSEMAAEIDSDEVDQDSLTKLALSAAAGAQQAFDHAAERHPQILPIKKPDPLASFSGRNEKEDG